MTWTTTEHAIVKGIKRDLKDVLNAIKGDLNKPGEPGMAETLRKVDARTDQIQTRINTNEESHTATHKRFRKLLAGVGLVALVALILHWTQAGNLIMGLVVLAIGWVT